MTKRFDVFISYRRKQGRQIADTIKALLTARGYRVFVDAHNMPGGPFPKSIERHIQGAPDFVPVLTPGSLPRRDGEQDWFVAEIEHALRLQRNLVPLLVDDFQFPADGEPVDWPKNVACYHGVHYQRSREATIDELCGYLQSTAGVRRRRLVRRLLALAAALLLVLALVALTSAIVSQRHAAARQLSLYWHGYGQHRVNGQWQEFPLRDGMTMRSGDQFRLVFAASEDCYVYVLNESAGGELNVLFPSVQIERGNRCRADRMYEIPDGGNWFTLDQQTGAERISLIASRDPLPDFDSILERSRAGEGDVAEEFKVAIRGLQKSINTRGIDIAPDARTEAAVTLQTSSGETVQQLMEHVPGARSVMRILTIEHAP